MAFRTNKTPVLQEKTASGSVASFNTILQKPLVNGEFTIQAYQEGTGDPSLDNVRNIIPFNTQKITKAGKNLFNLNNLVSDTWLVIDTINQSFENIGTSYTWYDIFDNSKILGGNYDLSKLDKAIFLKAGTYTLSRTDSIKPQLNIRTINTTDGTTTSVVTSQAASANFILSEDSYITIRVRKGVYTHFQIEVGSTATDYEPYVTPEVKTKQLGEDVYGGSYNSATGDKTKGYDKFVFNGSENWSLRTSGTTIYQCNKPSNMASLNADNYLLSRANIASPKPRASTQINEYYASASLFILNLGAATLQEHIDMLSSQNLEVVTLINEPIETNIGATPIETFNGANNIFCDTGDTSVVYNDLDIAKRGSFREVFKLP